jgi:hypothetical protein
MNSELGLAFQYAVITSKGRLALLGIAIIMILVLAIILRGFYILGVQLKHRFSKRSGKVTSPG